MVINLFFVIILVFTCRFRGILFIFIIIKVDNLDNQKLYFIFSQLVTYVANLDTNLRVILYYSFKWQRCIIHM
jgi:hypothetical protein